MKRPKVSSGDKGFTIVELLISTSVFSVVILVVTFGVIKIGNIYYKNITSSRTQSVTRSINSDIVTALQFTTDDVNPGGNIGGMQYFCIKDMRYRYRIGKQYVKGLEFSSGIFTEKLSGLGCDDPTTTQCANSASTGCVTPQRQLLGNKMRLLTLDITTLGNASNVYTVNVRVAYGDDDLLDGVDGVANPDNIVWANVRCKSGVSGSSYCAVAGLETTVKRMV